VKRRWAATRSSTTVVHLYAIPLTVLVFLMLQRVWPAPHPRVPFHADEIVP
jgi:hypothetical protein